MCNLFAHCLRFHLKRKKRKTKYCVLLSLFTLHNFINFIFLVYFVVLFIVIALIIFSFSLFLSLFIFIIFFCHVNLFNTCCHCVAINPDGYSLCPTVSTEMAVPLESDTNGGNNGTTAAAATAHSNDITTTHQESCLWPNALQVILCVAFVLMMIVAPISVCLHLTVKFLL